MRPLLLATLGSLTIGCTGNPAARSTDAPIRLQTELVLDMALGTDDSVVIGDLSHATRLDDGRIVAFDGDAMALVFFDSVGAVLHRSGRAGEGPGEFQNPDWVKTCNADSLFTYDASLRRVAVFDAQGAFVRQFTLPMAQPFRFGCNGHGTLAAIDASAIPFGPPSPGVEPPQLRGNLVIFNAAGDSVGGIADLRIGQSRVLGPLASLYMTRNELVVGVSDSNLFRRYDFTGTPMGTDTFPVTARPLTDSLYNAELDRMSGFGSADTQMQARIRQMLAAAPKLPVLPLYQEVHVTREGVMWLVTSISVDPTTTLVGRHPDGMLYALTLPARFQVFEIGNDYVLGQGSDADGGERLVMYGFDPLDR